MRVRNAGWSLPEGQGEGEQDLLLRFDADRGHEPGSGSAVVLGCVFERRPAASRNAERDARRTRRRDACATAGFMGSTNPKLSASPTQPPYPIPTPQSPPDTTTVPPTEYARAK